jgi:hypothetical protein
MVELQVQSSRDYKSFLLKGRIALIKCLNLSINLKPKRYEKDNVICGWVSCIIILQRRK